MEDTLNMAAHKVGPENSGPAVADAGQGAASQLDPATSKRKLCAKKRHDIHIALGLPASAVYQDDYSCALKRRGILLQGRMYVYDTHVAFYSNLLFGSFVTKLVIPVRSITSVSKHSNLGFPNSIKIRRGAFVDTFTSFLSRGAAFELVSRMVAVQQQTREAHEGQEQLSRRTTSQLLAKSGSAMSGGSSSVAGPPSPDGSVSVPRPSSPPGNSAAHSAVSSPRQQQQQQYSGNETADRSTSARNSISSSSRGGGGAGRHASMDGSSSSSCVPSPNGADSTRRASSSAVSSCSSLSTSSCTSSSTAPPCTTATTSPASSSLPTRASSLTTSASRCLISWGSASTLSSPGARKAHTFFASRWSRNSSSNSSSSTSGTTAQPLTHSFSSPFTCPPLPENSEPAAPGPQAVTTPCPAQRLPGARTGSCGLLRFPVVLAAAVSLLLLLVASFRVGERAYAYSANRAPQQAEMLRQRADGLQGRREDAAMEGDTVAVLRAHAQVILNEFALVSRGLSAVSHELGAVAGQMTAEGAAAVAAAAGCGAAIGCCGGELRCGGRFAGGKG